MTNVRGEKTGPTSINVSRYPVCSKCRAPYVLRLAIVVSPGAAGDQWIWQRDCKCRNAQPEIVEGKG